uniref:Putative secreted peptide n=1 Tax=Anopheles braziliensis TaxID=58242 RepID=A0A2M3ZN97_9DIPT
MRALSSIFVSVEYLTSMALFSHSASLMPASRFASATPESASLLTLAVCALPSDCKYCTSSYTSLIVKDSISMPIRPTSGAATSRTSAANWSRSLYTSSTVSVPFDDTIRCSKHETKLQHSHPHEPHLW